MANIKEHALFVVQTNDDVNSIRFDHIKEEIAPIAKQDNVLLGTTGKPGLMFPGKSMIYDVTTGKLDVASSAVKEYVGEIGYGTDEVKNMSGFEDAGNFYVVADFNHKYLSNDWGTPGSDLDYQTRVYLGDIVEKRNDETGDWNVIPMQIGNQHVHNDFIKYPHISATGNDTIVGSDSITYLADSVIQINENY